MRNFLIQKLSFDKVVGLAGPDINEYVNNIRFAHCNSIRIYENNNNILYKQLRELRESGKSVSLSYSDILNAPANMDNTLYDLDFCSSIMHMEKYIEKFRNNFIITFSVRPVGMKNTIKTFFEYREEEIKSVFDRIMPVNHSLYRTTGGSYLIAPYTDSVTMISIIKLPIYKIKL